MTFSPLIYRRPAITATCAGLLLAAGCATNPGQPDQAVYSPSPAPNPATATSRLKAPTGFYAAARTEDDFDGCPQTSAPHTGPLNFPSKYEGSDSARDDLNENAAQRYRTQVEPIRDLERGINTLVEDYLETADPAAVDCALDWMLEWARADAMTGPVTTHTGKSMRKWSLGSIASSYLRLKLSASEPLLPYQDQAAEVEDWLGELAYLVIGDWSNVPQRKFNNHEYWAAWAVMSVAVVVDDRQLFDWAVSQYDRAANQVTDDGYLNNELRRETRALFYHNYALPPLAMMAAFGHANGLDLEQRGDHALTRLAERVMSGLDQPEAFRNKAGAEQKLDDFKPSKFSWLEPYCSIEPCRGEFARRLSEYRPLDNYRVGGNVTDLFNPRESS
ncbi:mannuronate-specific alginate lyase [Abyssibacter sp.]|uniref:mannuronate-specific alginate lyase n=1 Tax=Abyssibacter sp. TaxID=2320200 RepID=UPI00351808AB